MIRPQDLKITWGRYEVYCKRVEDGRFIWEKNLTLFLGDRWEKSEDFLMFVKVFYGYKYYKPWVEMFLKGVGTLTKADWERFWLASALKI